MASRVAAHRALLREEGLKPVQMWLPDTSDGAVLKELGQMRLDIETYPGADDERAFIYALAQDEQWRCQRARSCERDYGGQGLCCSAKHNRASNWRS